MSSRESFLGATERPDYQRVTAADLRRRLDVLAPAPADLDGTSRRPTISGPATGCPFLLDARKLPPFAGLDLDPERTQTKGCTFCLDNSGAYVVPPAASVIAAWLEGVRRIRAARPDAREILLTDERPHPYLPAFFEAIAAEGLGPIELLWKSRADWLLEFRAEVEAACEIAARSGSIAHLYLVGFESFDSAHLELFNKGHGPEVNEAAIELMRALQERFPASFEHKRYRSHGILLFTPWTEPEHLIENARWMRRLRFHELRSEAVKTRLRLYPRVPLHRLAERDGLLAERFPEGRVDRAEEQGYDASVPWRFRDGRTEAAFHLANALHDADPSIADADVIEIAARFVVRWPGLASEPSLAHLPLFAALDAWGAPLTSVLRDIGPAGVAFDPEIEVLGLTSKRAALKECVAGERAEQLVRAYRAMGLCAEVVQRHAIDPATGTHSAGKDRAMIAVAANDTALAEVLEAQRRLSQTKGSAEQAEAVAELGALMGYPPCCAAAFGELADRGDNLKNERAPFERHPDVALHPLLHRTGAVRLVSHHLCSPACSASIAMAERLAARLDALDPGAAQRLHSAMSHPSLFIDYERNAVVDGAWDGDVFRVERVHEVGRSRELEALLAGASFLAPAPGGLRIASRDGSERDLPAVSWEIFIPGKACPQIKIPAAKDGLPLAGAPTVADVSRPPPLPAAFRPGVRCAAFVIASIEKQGSATVVTLGRGREKVAVRLRPHEEGAPFTLRAGRWACDVDDPRGLSEPARAAIAVLVRALPKW